jgi:hypothetical protein
MEHTVSTTIWMIKVKISLSVSRLNQGFSKVLYYLKRMHVVKMHRLINYQQILVQTRVTFYYTVIQVYVAGWAIGFVLVHLRSSPAFHTTVLQAHMPTNNYKVEQEPYSAMSTET